MTTFPREEIEATLARYIAVREAIERGEADWPDLAQFFTDDAVYIDPAWGRVQGIEHLKEFFVESMRGLEDWTFPVDFTWQQAPSSQFVRIGSQSINRAATGKSVIVAVGFEDPPRPDGGDPVAWRSIDGLHWDLFSKPTPGTQGMDGVAFDGKRFVAEVRRAMGRAPAEA